MVVYTFRPGNAMCGSCGHQLPIYQFYLNEGRHDNEDDVQWECVNCNGYIRLELKGLNLPRGAKTRKCLEQFNPLRCAAAWGDHNHKDGKRCYPHRTRDDAEFLGVVRQMKVLGPGYTVVINGAPDAHFFKYGIDGKIDGGTVVPCEVKTDDDDLSEEQETIRKMWDAIRPGCYVLSRVKSIPRVVMDSDDCMTLSKEAEGWSDEPKSGDH